MRNFSSVLSSPTISGLLCLSTYRKVVASCKCFLTHFTAELCRDNLPPYKQKKGGKGGVPTALHSTLGFHFREEVRRQVWKASANVARYFLQSAPRLLYSQHRKIYQWHEPGHVFNTLGISKNKSTGELFLCQAIT